MRSTLTYNGAPISGVSVAGGAGVGCTTSNAAGLYTCTVPQGYTGAITPTLTSYNFTPPSRSYSTLAADTSGQNYSATPSTNNGQPLNVAAIANGALQVASSTYSGHFPVSAVGDGERKGLNWGNGGGWFDATYATYPDWVQVNFNGTQTIGEISAA